MNLKPRVRLSKTLTDKIVSRAIGNKTQDDAETLLNANNDLFGELKTFMSENFDVLQDPLIFVPVKELNIIGKKNELLHVFRTEQLCVPYFITQENYSLNLFAGKHPCEGAKAIEELCYEIRTLRQKIADDSIRIRTKLEDTLKQFCNVRELIEAHPYIYDLLPDEAKEETTARVNSLDELLENA